MKKNRINYPKADQLPFGAIPVKDYAEREGFSITWVYKLYKQGLVEIVDYYGKNYVLP